MINDFDPPKIRKQLNALRQKHGADSPVGHRCSNLVQQLESHATATGERRKDLEKHIAKSVDDLAKLTARLSWTASSFMPLPVKNMMSPPTMAKPTGKTTGTEPTLNATRPTSAVAIKRQHSSSLRISKPSSTSFISVSTPEARRHR